MQLFVHPRCTAGVLSLAFCVTLLVVTCSRAVSEACRELYRIRITNAADGLVEVSIDGGESFHAVGRVITPVSASIRGYSASVYAERGTVAGIAVHGLRIKTGQVRHGATDIPYIISVVPREFAATPRGFGGHVSGPAGIYTDIPAGTAIFREFAPFVGNPVFFETAEGLVSLRRGYEPKRGDVLHIVARIPLEYPKEVVFENKAGGLVKARYPNEVRVIAKVVQPARGVGRFDATGYTGVGRVNTNHTGVITISTAPISSGRKDASSIETRGGFQIQPSRHARKLMGIPQVLVVGPVSGNTPALEGQAPLFSGCIGLASDPSDENNSFRTEIKTSKSEWAKLPPLVGKRDDAFTRRSGGAMVTQIRILFPEYTEKVIKQQLSRCRRAYVTLCRERAKRDGRMPVRGIVKFELWDIDSKAVQLVSFYLNGKFSGMTNTPPYVFPLNANHLPDGEHVVALRAVDKDGLIVKHTKSRILVIKDGRP